MKNLRVEGAFTHLCVDDTDCPEDQAFSLSQAQAFLSAVDELKHRGFECAKIHMQSSCGVLNYPELAGDCARVGIALYGVMSTRDDCNQAGAELWPVLSLHVRIASVREVMAGEGAGYGLAFMAQRPTCIATLTIGYADGLPRALSCGVGEVLIKGHRAPIVGRICMDQTLVDVTGVPSVQAGDEVTLIGRSEGEEISAYEVAEQAGTITNEILSRLGTRLQRVVR